MAVHRTTIYGKICAFLLCTLCGCTSLEEKPLSPAQKATPAEKLEQWKPVIPNPKDFDWIRLKSDEWLKGEVTILRNNELEFDSDELDDLVFDWEDIRELRSPRMNSLRFKDDSTAQGTLLITEKMILVKNGDQELRFDRDQLMTIIPGEPKEINYWSGKVSLGFDSRTGNTRQVDYTGSMLFKRRTLESRITLSYMGNFEKVEGDETANNHKFTGVWNYFLTPKYYLVPIGLDAYRDTFQNLDYQLTPMTGVGYHIYDEPKLEWDVELAVGYRYKRYESVASGQDNSDDEVSPIGITRFEKEINKDIDLLFKYMVFMDTGAMGDSDHHTTATISIDLTSDLDLDITFVWDRIGDPEADSSGDTPDSNDFHITIGLGLEF